MVSRSDNSKRSLSNSIANFKSIFFLSPGERFDQYPLLKVSLALETAKSITYCSAKKTCFTILPSIGEIFSNDFSEVDF